MTLESLKTWQNTGIRTGLDKALSWLKGIGVQIPEFKYARMFISPKVIFPARIQKPEFFTPYVLMPEIATRGAPSLTITTRRCCVQFFEET